MKSGIIIAIPTGKRKCPEAVTSNIADIEILPESEWSKTPFLNLTIIELIIKTPDKIYSISISKINLIKTYNSILISGLHNIILFIKNEYKINCKQSSIFKFQIDRK